MVTAVEHRGEHGTAVLLTIPADDPRAAATLDYWLLTAPGWSPGWSQYILACIRLDDVADRPAPHRRFVGATHELTVAALSPLFEPYTANAANALMAGGGLPILHPRNIVEQFEATDIEMRRVCEAAAKAVCDGGLNPETDGAEEAVRMAWLGFIVRALAHLRGEDHA